MPIRKTTTGAYLNENAKLLQGLNIPTQNVAGLVTDGMQEMRVLIYHRQREEYNRRRFYITLFNTPRTFWCEISENDEC
jgi:hypothetical protein